LADRRPAPHGARVGAAQIIHQVVGGRSLSDALAERLPLLGESERPLTQELAFGVARWYPRLALLRRAVLSRPLKAREGEVGALLLVGLYQLLYTDLPPHAAVSETVEAARRLGRPWATGLVNGVLRRVQRDREALLEQVARDPEGRYAHPRWLIERLREAWPERWEALLEAGNQRPPMTLRVNRLEADPSDYCAQLAAAGIAARRLDVSETAVRLDVPLPVERLPGFREGRVSVQDGGAQIAAPLLDVRPGHRVLDACAAPGGKTCHILECQPALERLVAVDVDEARLARVRDNLKRLGLDAQLHVGDAARPSGPWAAQPYDRILLDVPCSATGVIRRHPDIKLLRRERDLASLAAGQARMIGAVWPLLRQGGMLLYATCSILPEENDRQVAGFLNATADARERPIVASWGHPRPVGRQMLPGEGDVDGFYYARLEKV
jgi:16S rRNA (cytosine967-C5)-methyltransferase